MPLANHVLGKASHSKLPAYPTNAAGSVDTGAFLSWNSTNTKETLQRSNSRAKVIKLLPKSRDWRVVVFYFGTGSGRVVTKSSGSGTGRDNQSINHLFQCRQCWTNIHVLDLFDAPLTPCAHGSRDILHRRTLSPASFILYQVLEDICFWFWNKSKNGRKKSHH